jgi:transcriptional regulator with XRE-family HTH domain
LNYKEEKLVDRSFAKRLNTACDGHPHIPEYGHGRQTWVKENLKVSHEAVRKWFTGEARPRPSMMRELAKTLEVDEAWLSLGITPDLKPRERRSRNAQAEGAVNVLAGIIQLNGGHCAFPDENDPRGAYVDLYAIVRGASHALHVSLATKFSIGQFNFVVPKEFEDCRVIGAVHASTTRVHFIDMTTDLINKAKVRKGGFFLIGMNWHDNSYWSGPEKWPRIENFAKDF